MKNSIYILCFATLYLLAGCSEEDDVLFSDKHSYFAFARTVASVAEDGKTLDIAIDWAKAQQVAGTLELEVVTNPDAKADAVEGVDFTLSAKTLSFAADEYSKTVQVTTTYDDTYTGDKSFIIRMKSTGTAAQLGSTDDSNNMIKVTVIDVDHPLSAFLGDAKLNYTSYWDGPFSDDIEISTDPDQEDVLWLTWIGGVNAIKMTVIDNGEGYTVNIALPQNFGWGANPDVEYIAVWNNGGQLAYTHSDRVISGITEYDPINVVFDESIGMHGPIYGWFEMALPGTMVITK